MLSPLPAVLIILAVAWLLSMLCVAVILFCQWAIAQPQDATLVVCLILVVITIAMAVGGKIGAGITTGRCTMSIVRDAPAYGFLCLKCICLAFQAIFAGGGVFGHGGSPVLANFANVMLRAMRGFHVSTPASANLRS